VYVHPLPPTADIVLPVNADGEPVAAGGPFETIFYPGTRVPGQFAPIGVGRGATIGGIDFAVQRRASVSMHGISTYTFFGENPVSPAYLSSSGTIAARGMGITNAEGAVPSLTARVLGSSVSLAPNGIRAYAQPQTALALDLVLAPNAGAGPRHLLFSTPGDLYVLPAGLHVAARQPPAISSIATNPDGSVTIAGVNLGPDSRVFFDGLPAQVRVPFAGDDQAGALTVSPPPGTAGQRATVMVFAADGQNSAFLQSQSPFTYTYETGDAPSISLSLSAIPAGSSAMVDVNAPNARFLDGQPTIGFGSSDIAVHRVWVVSPTRLVANVTVSPHATPGAYSVSLMSGFQVLSVPFGFQTLPANPRLPLVALPLLNAITGQTLLYPGAAASLYGVNLVAPERGGTVTLNDQPVQVFFASANQINFLVPGGISLGPAILKVHNGLEAATPVLVHIDAAPPVILSVTSGTGAALEAAQPPRAGDTLNMIVSGLDPAIVSAPHRLKITVGTFEAQVANLAFVPGQPGNMRIQFAIPPEIAGAQPLTLFLDGVGSAPVLVPIR
jgi:uncharacterized protein (TIGR03437 family)